MKKLFTLFALTFISFTLRAQPPPYKVINNNNAPGGYYFVAPFLTSGLYSYNMILDSMGNTVYFRFFPDTIAVGFCIQPNKLISFIDLKRNMFFLMDSSFTVVDTITAQNGITTDIHELQILPNGHYLLLGTEMVTMDLTSYHYFNNTGNPGSPEASVTCAVIQELDANKNVVFEWHAKDYFSFDSVDPFWMSDPTNVDWTHANALELDKDGNILLSCRHLNEITKINRQDSSIIWRFGGNYNQFTFIGDQTRFYGQHDIRRQSNGNVTLFDDGDHGPPHGARGLEYELDETNKTAHEVWAYTYDPLMYSFAMGSTQRTSNSEFLVDYGYFNSEGNACFNVVDTLGNEVFRFFCNSRLNSYRTFNYARLPWSLPQPQISCFRNNDTLFLDAGSGYSSYLWGNGSTTQTVAVTSPDTFQVFVPYGQGGYLGSAPLIVTNVSSTCNVTAVKEDGLQDDVKVYPNPAHDVIYIRFKSGENTEPVLIKDVSGRIVETPPLISDAPNRQFTVNTASLAEGFYILSAGTQSFRFIKN